MVNVDSVKKFVIETICEVVADADIDMDTLLFEEDILDSLSILYLIEELEAEYNIEVPLEEVTENNFSTVNNISNYVMERICRG